MIHSIHLFRKNCCPRADSRGREVVVSSSSHGCVVVFRSREFSFLLRFETTFCHRYGLGGKPSAMEAYGSDLVPVGYAAICEEWATNIIRTVFDEEWPVHRLRRSAESDWRNKGSIPPLCCSKKPDPPRPLQDITFRKRTLNKPTAQRKKQDRNFVSCKAPASADTKDREGPSGRIPGIRVAALQHSTP